MVFKYFPGKVAVTKKKCFFQDDVLLVWVTASGNLLPFAEDHVWYSMKFMLMMY